MADDVSSIPVIAVTAAVGAVVLLIVLLCTISRGDKDDKNQEDRVMMLWSTKEFSQKEHKFIRLNVDLDSATSVKFSPDSRALVASLANGNKIRVFRLGKKDDGSGNVGVAGTMDFPQVSPAEIINVGISSKGTFIMAGLADTHLIIYDLKGEQQEVINTHQMKNYFSALSPCGRFVASSGFTPDVKIWEVSGTPGELKVTRAMELKGHNSGVSNFSFNGDSSRVATVSKDGTWKLWDTDVRYSQGQDAKLLFTGSVSLPGPNLIAISPDGRTVAISGDSSVVFWDTVTQSESVILQDLHSGPITALQFNTSNHYLVTAGDKHLQVLHNVPGYYSTIADLEQREKKATSAGMRERILEQIKEARQTLSNILGESNEEVVTKKDRAS
ncbi:hypothetical protein C0Q70_08297 [Pomacea canaliculata]|uniref:Uncharacterized protein n=1 Tax=Pomacea canaliculata TaxID=400727 RepID=A0A2T7PHH9_POMCA|nr:hypothetical protein C0Q70_08297 [Pomacea canaliculata]